MNDQQLLELAAKAAGIEVWPGTGFQAHMLFTRPAKADPDGKVTGVEWNPRDDDGDALRLAVSLRLDVTFVGNMVVVYWYDERTLMSGAFEEPINDAQDEREATRRAIVRAAAAIGKEM
ncbi:hypothetical protein ACOTEY_00435 [Achromobacter xylosoxidans]